MTVLTDDSLSANLINLGEAHFPFKATLAIVPAESQGRRFVTVRDGQKLAHLIEDELEAASWNIAIPTTYIPQFGQQTAKIIIYGFVDPADESFLADLSKTNPTEEITRIHSGTVPGENTDQITGPSGGSLSYGQDPTSDTNDLVTYLKTYLENDSTYIGSTATILKIEAQGVTYGQNNRTFPV